MPPSKPDIGWANRTVREFHDAFPAYKWRNGEESQFAQLLTTLPRDRDHATYAVAWMLEPVEDSRGQLAQRRFAGVMTLREAIVATGPDRGMAATIDARDAILRAFPHDFLAIEAVPAGDGMACPTCCASDRWDRWGLRADHPLRVHLHPVWTTCPENWPDEQLVRLYGGPLAWTLAFQWAKTHSPSGDRVDRYHPVASRIGFDTFDRIEREYLDTPGAKSKGTLSRKVLDGILHGFREPTPEPEPEFADVLGLE